LHFPPFEGSDSPANIKVDLLERRGSAWLVVRPGEEDYIVPLEREGVESKAALPRLLSVRVSPRQNGEVKAQAAVLAKTLRTDGHVSPKPLSPSQSICSSMDSVKHSAAVAAKNYLERHQLVPFMHGLLHAVIREKPANPLAFMACQFPKLESKFGAMDVSNEGLLCEIQLENGRLREEVARLQDELKDARTTLEELQQVQECGKQSRRGKSSSEDISSLPTSPSNGAGPILSFSKRGAALAQSSAIEQGLEKFWERLKGGESSDEFRVLRQSVFTGRWTVYCAGGTHKKPSQYSGARKFPHILDQPQHEMRCPFCVGNEHKTPDPLLVMDDDGEMLENCELPDNWRVRVIPNIFPLLVTPKGAYGEAFQKKLESIPHSSVSAGRHQNDKTFWRYSSEMYALAEAMDDIELSCHRQVDAVGYSEVVIEDRQHKGLLAIVSPEQVSLSLRAMQHRGKILARESQVRQILYFKQYGAISGGSLVHPHMQLVTLPLQTPTIENRISRAVDFHNTFGECAVCHCLRDEVLKPGPASSRLLHQSKHFLAVVPFASRQFRITLVPRVHSHSWLSISQEEVEDLGNILQLCMEAYYHILDDPSYSIFLYSVDAEGALEPHEQAAVHWVVEIMPRLEGDVGGVELASGIRVVNGLPEDFASDLRKAIEGRVAARLSPRLQSSATPGAVHGA
jgi:UDPglucose--hexose-1-phosphate uridylyltransferase